MTGVEPEYSSIVSFHPLEGHVPFSLGLEGSQKTTNTSSSRYSISTVPYSIVANNSTISSRKTSNGGVFHCNVRLQNDGNRSIFYKIQAGTLGMGARVYLSADCIYRTGLDENIVLKAEKPRTRIQIRE